MRYKVGEIVRVKSDLKNDWFYGARSINLGMLKSKGEQLTIKSCEGGIYYTVEESVWEWTDEMFEEEVSVTVKKMRYKVGESVRVRSDLGLNTYYGDDVLVTEMMDFRGKRVTIERVEGDSYIIVGCPWDWTDEMFEEEVEDQVNHPNHYTGHPSGIECIEITQHFNFTIGNAIKYLWRQGLKEEGNREKQLEDLKKSIWYINQEIKRIGDG